MGLVYLTLTLACMAMYAGIIEPSTTNDLYWASYNRSGCMVFLMDIVNAKLQSGGIRRAESTPIDLVRVPDAVSPKEYADGGVQTTHEATYGRYLVFSELSSMPRGVRSLRKTATRAITTIYAQYCWVDLDRRWELAHSSARAARCLERYADNAANYLETTVRNTDWTNFVEWNGDTWAVAIAAALDKTPDGVQWLADRPRHALSLSIDGEVQFLEQRNLTRFELQYQNDYYMAISETIDVVNALDQRRTVWLKGVSFGPGSWTTLLMYWNFRNDLLISASFNQSLVRGDASHFEQVTGSALSSLYGVSDENDHYYDQFGVFHDQVGPFGGVDVLYVPLPLALKAMYTTIHDLIDPRDLTMSPAVPEPVDRSALTLIPSPPNFLVPLGMTYWGGNLLCFDNPPTPFPQSQFTIDDACTETKPFSMAATKRAMVFALLATPNPDIPAICAVQTTVATHSCHDALTHVAKLIKLSFDASPDATAVRQLVSAATTHLSTIQFVQYAQPPNSTEWTLLQQPLLVDDDPNWSFYGWLAFFDWIEGKREVVRLEGDVSTVSMMSDLNPPVEGTSISQHPDEVQSGPKTLLFLVYYTTGMAVALGAVVVFYAVRSGLAFAGRNLVAFHRVAGIVWIGRPLLLLRGLTAILILSTTTAVLVRDEVDVAKLVASPRSWWEILILAGEATCVCGVVCDLLLITATELAHLFTPLACLLSWGVTVVLDVVDPIAVELILDRQCTMVDLQRGVTCTAGTLAVGSFHRMAVLMAIQGASVVTCLIWVVLLTRFKQRRKQSTQPPLLLYGAAEAFLTNQDQYLDDVASVLTGLVPFSFRGRQYTFDVKLWVLLQAESPSSSRKLKLGGYPGPTLALSEVIPATSQKTSFYRQLTVFGGFGYLILSAIGSVSYISLSTVNFANDFYWATFNLTGHHVVIADWFHLNLPTRDVLASVRLDEARWTTEASNYSNPKLRLLSYSLIGSILQSKHTTKLDVAIAGLRRSDACGIPWISTQYCWVDFGRQWPMANSAARQRRCRADAANGAVYLEAVLRNVDWAAWTACWGASFDTAIANELKLTVHGQAWLASTQAAFASDIASEIALWRKAGIEEYVVQWQNYKSLGLINTYVIENALGVQYPMTLRRSNGSYYFPYQTSFKMYWGLGSDLWAVASNSTAISGKSLISTSANYAFANQSMVAVLLENHTIVAPLFEAFQLVQGEIGPFGSIDMRVVPCPASVQAVVATAIDVIQRTIASQPSIASHGFFKLPDDIMFPIPGVFKRLPASSFKTTGGSILCPETTDNDLELGLLRLTRREKICGGAYAANLPAASYGLLFAAMAAQLHQANTSQVDGVCWHLADSEQCLATFLIPTVSFVETFIQSDEVAVITDLVPPAVASVRQLQVSLIQFLRSPTGDIQLGRAALLDADDASFDFWSWMYVITWATGSREVVTFQGDMGAVTIITDVADSESQAIYNEDLPTTFAAYAQRGVQYITGVMLAVAGCAGLCILSSRWRVEGLNMFELNRVAGIVWVGRPLLLLRGVTALGLLSTSTLELVRVGDLFAAFQVARLPWYTAVLGAGEVTWVVFVLNDVLMVWTTDLTQVYAAWSSIFIWITCAVLTVVWPVGHYATIEPACQIDQMDFQLVCQSGVVAIGDSTRLVWLVAIVVLWNAVCFAGPWLAYRSRLPSKSAHASLLLSTGAKFLFDRTHWMYDGVYHMDTASALLNGVVAVHWGRAVYVVDVKLWRAFVLAVEADVPERLVRAVPLPR